MRGHRMLKVILMILLLGCGMKTAAAAGDNSPAAPSVTGALRVEGTQLMGSNGEAVQLKGISTHGLAWFPDYVNEECFRQLHEEWKANVIRLAMYTAEYGGYCTDGDKESLKDLVNRGVQYAKAQDMYVIIDWHILSDGNPNENKEEAKAFFEEMSGRYAGEEHVLYEICNEPNGGTSWQEIKAYAQEIIPVIRANDEEAVILVGTPNWSQDVDEAALDPISGYDNIMYVLHFYAATHKEELRSKMTAAQEAGLAVFVSEYGICDASGSGAIDEEQANAWIEEMDRCGISYVAWNLSNKDETSAILKSSCTKTSGFTAEDLSEAGRWLYAMLSGEKAAEEESEMPNDTSPGGETDGMPESGALEEMPEGGMLVSADGVEATVQIVNSWETEGSVYNQYDMTVKNISENARSGWEIEIQFGQEFALSDGWNGEYSREGNTLRIISKEYNGNLAAGEAAGDIGFILSFSQTES